MGEEDKGRGGGRRGRGRRGWGVGRCQVGQGALTLLAVEDRQEAEHEGPAGRCKEASPVIPDGEVGRHDLDAEQDAWGQR